MQQDLKNEYEEQNIKFKKLQTLMREIQKKFPQYPLWKIDALFPPNDENTLKNTLKNTIEQCVMSNIVSNQVKTQLKSRREILSVIEIHAGSYDKWLQIVKFYELTQKVLNKIVAIKVVEGLQISQIIDSHEMLQNFFQQDREESLHQYNQLYKLLESLLQSHQKSAYNYNNQIIICEENYLLLILSLIFNDIKKKKFEKIINKEKIQDISEQTRIIAHHMVGEYLQNLLGMGKAFFG